MGACDAIEWLHQSLNNCCEPFVVFHVTSALFKRGRVGRKMQLGNYLLLTTKTQQKKAHTLNAVCLQLPDKAKSQYFKALAPDLWPTKVAVKANSAFPPFLIHFSVVLSSCFDWSYSHWNSTFPAQMIHIKSLAATPRAYTLYFLGGFWWETSAEFHWLNHYTDQKKKKWQRRSKYKR